MIIVCFSSPVTGLKIQHMILPCDRFVRRVIFTWKNLALSCEYNFDAGGSVSPLLSLHSIWGCGNHPAELHSTMTPWASGAWTWICVSNPTAGENKKIESGYCGEVVLTSSSNKVMIVCSVNSENVCINTTFDLQVRLACYYLMSIHCRVYFWGSWMIFIHHLNILIFSKQSIFNKWIWEKWMLTCRNMKLDQYLLWSSSTHL